MNWCDVDSHYLAPAHFIGGIIATCTPSEGDHHLIGHHGMVLYYCRLVDAQISYLFGGHQHGAVFGEHISGGVSFFSLCLGLHGLCWRSQHPQISLLAEIVQPPKHIILVNTPDQPTS